MVRVYLDSVLILKLEDLEDNGSSKPENHDKKTPLWSTHVDWHWGLWITSRRQNQSFDREICMEMLLSSWKARFVALITVFINGMNVTLRKTNVKGNLQRVVLEMRNLSSACCVTFSGSTSSFSCHMFMGHLIYWKCFLFYDLIQKIVIERVYWACWKTFVTNRGVRTSTTIWRICCSNLPCNSASGTILGGHVSLFTFESRSRVKLIREYVRIGCIDVAASKVIVDFPVLSGKHLSAKTFNTCLNKWSVTRSLCIIKA